MKCYIASGFFNQDQLLDIDIIKAALNSTKIEFFSPKDENLALPDDGSDKLQKVFEVNIAEIISTDFIICNTRDKDMGSLFEAGFAYGQNKPIIYYNRELRQGQPFNLMLAKSGIAVTTSLIDLIKVLEKLVEDINYKQSHKQEIE